MTIYITAKQVRTVSNVSTDIQPLVHLQLDVMSAQEAAVYGGATEFIRYDAISWDCKAAVWQNDTFVDLVNTDHTNHNKPVKYQATIESDPFPDGHTQLVLHRARGG